MGITELARTSQQGKAKQWESGIGGAASSAARRESDTVEPLGDSGDPGTRATRSVHHAKETEQWERHGQFHTASSAGERHEEHLRVEVPEQDVVPGKGSRQE